MLACVLILVSPSLSLDCLTQCCVECGLCQKSSPCHYRLALNEIMVFLAHNRRSSPEVSFISASSFPFLACCLWRGIANISISSHALLTPRSLFVCCLFVVAFWKQSVSEPLFAYSVTFFSCHLLVDVLLSFRFSQINPMISFICLTAGDSNTS